MLESLQELLTQMFVGQNEFVAFVGAALFGTPFIILVASLAEQADVSFWSVLIFSFLGDALAGYLWFSFGRYSKFMRWHRLRRRSAIARGSLVLKRMLHTNKLRAFMLPHVLYGTKIISFAYFGRADIAPRTFLFYNLPFSAAWTTVLVSLGWVLGKGVVYVQSFIDSFILAVWLSVIGCVAFYFLVLWIAHTVSKEIR